MSKKSRNRSRSRRVTTVNANRRLPTTQYDLINFIEGLPARHPSPSIAIEDRRTFHPDGEFRNARSYNSSSHSLVVGSPAPASHNSNRFTDVPNSVAFASPDKVMVCVRRNARKEVLHALKKTGKSGQKRPRRSAYSDINC